MSSLSTYISFPKGVTTYDSIDDLPLTGVDEGTMAYVSGNTRVYFWNGSGWYSLALVNTAPTITTGADDTYELAIDGTATVITLEASDPEGVPLTWSYSVTSGSIGNTATVSQSANVFTITPSTNEADAGEFSLTFTASDGINTATDTAAFTLTFVIVVENSTYTTALITGAAASQNQSITDSSSNNHTVTVNGDASSQTFSPYRSGGYSYYFDGNGDYLRPSTGTTLDFGSNDFTVECWFNASEAAASTDYHLLSYSSTSSNFWALRIRNAADRGLEFRWYEGSEQLAIYQGSDFTDTWVWHHIAITRDGSSWRMFLDGTQVGSTVTNTGTITNFTTFDIGALLGGNGTFNGYIKDVRITNGSAVYTADFTPPTERLEAITNTALLTCHLPYVKDGSTNDHSITITGNVSPKPFGPYDYSEYNSATHGGSVYFDGSSDYIGTTIASGFGSSDFTFEFWLYKTSDSGFLFNSRTSGIASDGFDLQYDLDTTTAGAHVFNSVSLNTNHWYHIAYVRSGSTFKRYINGTLNASTTNSTNFSGSDFYIGGSPHGNIGSLRGYMEDVRVVVGTAVYTADFTPPTEPLTAIAGTELLISGTDAGVVDKSQRNQLTLTGNTTGSTTQTKYGTSMYFDGSGDYITLTDSEFLNMGTGDFTVECWYKHVSTPGNYPSILSGKAWTGGGVGIRYDNFNAANKFAFFWNGIGDPWLASSSTFNTTDWHHVALTRSGTTFTLWVNGTSQATGTNSGSIDWAFGGDCKVGWGEWDGSNGLLNAYIEDLRITKGLARYTANFTPPTASLEG